MLSKAKRISREGRGYSNHALRCAQHILRGLTGHFEESTEVTDVNAVLEEIKAAFAEEQARRERLREANEEG